LVFPSLIKIHVKDQTFKIKKRLLELIGANKIFATTIKKALLDLADIKPSMIVADAGCGLGDTSFSMAKYVGKTGKIIGFDHAKLFVDAANNTLNSKHKDLADIIEFEAGDMFNLKYADNTFDVIVCERVMQHLENYEAALNSLIRVLKPGGRLVVQDPCWTTLVFSGADEIICHKLASHALNVIRNPRMGMQMPVILKKLGLTNVHIQPATWYCENLADCVAFNLT